MRWATLVLAAILVLGSASVAVAECAWVLWSKIVRSEYTGLIWNIEAAYAERPKCIHGRNDVLEAKARFFTEGVEARLQGVKVQSIPEEGLLRLSHNKGKAWVYFLCLPDTIDPRKQKE